MRPQHEILIGIAGKACAGKDTVAAILREFGFAIVNSAELVAAENNLGGPKPTRHDQRELANSKRAELGSDYWARQAYARGYEAMRAVGTDRLAIVGIYSPAEADFVLRQHKSFLLGSFLLGVTCDSQRERHHRYLKRYSSDTRRIMTFTDFVAADKEESSGALPSDANVEAVLQKCKICVSNDSDEESLRNQVLKLMADLGIDQQEFILESAPQDRNFDNFEDVFRLEQQTSAIDFLRDHLSLASRNPAERALSPLLADVHAVHHVSDEFARRLCAVFMESSVETAYDEYLKLESHTTDEELACSLNQKQFGECFGLLRDHLRDTSEHIRDRAIRNLQQIAKCDEMQFDRTPTSRSLSKMVQEGIWVEIQPGSACDTWIQALDLAGNGPIPVTELLKTARIVKASKIANSKVSLVIHDAVDHLWFIHLLDSLRIFDRHQLMMEKIGNFTNCDIYKRESEMVASISFGTRSWTNYEIGYSPTLTTSDILGMFDHLFDHDQLEDHHLDAYRHVRYLASQPHRRESQSLGFVYSNYVTELDEQRRRFGKIKVMNPDTYEREGELDPKGADYLSFFVDAHRALHDRKNKHRDTLLRVHVLFEYYLSNRELAESGDGLSFHFNPVAWDDELFREASLKIPQERLLWIASNYGFTAVRERVL